MLTAVGKENLMKKLLLIFLFFLTSAAVGCGNLQPGSVQSARDTPIVTITAGKVFIPGPGYLLAAYLIDTQTRSCWIRIGEQLGALDCGNLMGVPGAAKYLTWFAAPPSSGAPAEKSVPPTQQGGAAAVENI
jgi:hypothetical protein